jgi:wzx
MNSSNISKRKILGDSVWFGVVPKLSIVITVIIMPYITPFLTSIDYGIWGIITSYSGLFTAFSTMGLQIHLTNTYYEYPNNYSMYWGKLHLLILLSNAFCAIILFFILYYLLKDQLDVSHRIVVACLGTFPILFYSGPFIANHFYVLIGKPRTYVLRNLLSSVLGIIVLFIFVYYLRLGYLGYVFSTATVSFVAFGLFFKTIWFDKGFYPILEKNRTVIKQWLKIAAPLIPHTLGFVLLSSSSRLIMSWLGISFKEIGYFSNGYSMGDYITIVASSIAMAIVPYMQIAYRDKNFSRYRSLFYFSQLIVLVAVFLFSIWLPEIYKILVRNEDLQQCASIASYTCFANVFYPLYVFVSTIAFIEKRTGLLLYLVFIPAIINILLCLIFIPVYGYKVAIVSTMISYWSQLFIPFFVKYFNVKTKQWLGSLNKLLILLLLGASLVISANFLAFSCFSIKIMLTILLLLVVFLIPKRYNLF